MDLSPFIYGLLGLTGALAFDIWTFLKNAPEVDSNLYVFDWRITLTTIMPSAIAAFLGGFYAHPIPPVDYVLFVTAGFAAASAQGLLGLRSFWRAKTTPVA